MCWKTEPEVASLLTCTQPKLQSQRCNRAAVLLYPRALSQPRVRHALPRPFHFWFPTMHKSANTVQVLVLPSRRASSEVWVTCLQYWNLSLWSRKCVIKPAAQLLSMFMALWATWSAAGENTEAEMDHRPRAVRKHHQPTAFEMLQRPRHRLMEQLTHVKSFQAFNVFSGNILARA